MKWYGRDNFTMENHPLKGKPRLYCKRPCGGRWSGFPSNGDMHMDKVARMDKCPKCGYTGEKIKIRSVVHPEEEIG